jgi:hypothetical protein
MGKRRDDISIEEVKRRIATGEKRADIARSYKMSASAFTHWCKSRGIDTETTKPKVDDRDVMPEGLDVRTLPDVPHMLFGADGIVYSDRFDPPRALFPTQKKGRNARLRSGKGHISVAREMCRAWHGEPSSGEVVEFADGDPDNIVPANLGWGMPKVSISARQFIQTWQTSESVAEVADKLGLHYVSAFQRAARMRERGVPLKEMSGRREDYESLADFAREFLDDEDA